MGIILVIISLFLIVGMMLKRRKAPKDKIFSDEKVSPYKIQSTRRILNGMERESEVKSGIIISSKVGELEVLQNEVEELMNISYLRSKYRNKIENIREKIHFKHKNISLGGIDEILILIEKINLKGRSDIQNTFLEKLLDYAIRLCEKNNEELINESYIKKANLMVYKEELDLISKISVIEELSDQEVLNTPKQIPKKVKILEKEVTAIEPEEKLEEPEFFQEVEIEPKTEDKMDELEIIKEELLPTPQEIPKDLDFIQEDVDVSTSEDRQKELVSPELNLIKCPFCNFQIDTKKHYCPQCGYIIKK